MATFYANARGGSDSNNGTSWALAKLTLSGVNGVASAGDTVLCHGVFRETIPVSKRLFWVGYGYCEFNGNGGAGVIPASNTSYQKITFTGWSNSPFVGEQNTGVNISLCVFRDMVYGLYLTVSSATIGWIVSNCAFYGLTAGMYMTRNTGTPSTGYINFYNCVMFGNTKDIETNTSGTYLPFSCFGCCFGSSIMISTYGTIYAPHDWNVYDFTNGKCVSAGVDKTTLATWKAAVGTLIDSGSIDRVWRNDVGDYANRALRSNPSGYLLTAGSGSSPVGLYLPALTVSNNTNASMWTGGVFVNTEIDGSGYIVLSAGQTSGTAATDVIDLGANINTNSIELLAAGEDSTHYFDTDTGDSPNFLNIEFRGSQSVFTKSAGSPSWTVLPRGGEIGASVSPHAWRYIQVRVTLRG